MKRIPIFTILLALTVLSSVAQITKFFDKYAETDGVTSVYISKTMLNMMPDMKSNGMDMKAMAGKLDNIRILTTENPQLVSKLRKDLSSSFNSKEYEELLRVNEGKEKTVIYMKTSPSGVNEYLILSEEANELNAILITGKITPSDIQKAINK